MKILVAFPLPFWQRLAHSIGILIYHSNIKRIHIINDNLNIAFPDLTESQKQTLCKKVVINTILGFFESFFGWWAPDSKILKHSELQGLNTLKDAMKDGSGVIILGAHFTTMELSARVMGVRKKVDAVYRKQNNPYFDRIILTARQQHFDQLILKSDTRQLIRRLKNGSAIWLAIDQDAGRKSAVFPTFFSQQASTVSIIDKLVKITDAKILFYSHFRVGYGKNTKYIGKFHPPIPLNKNYTSLETTQCINDKLEDILKANDISQYFWVHRRYKTRPNNSDKTLYTS